MYANKIRCLLSLGYAIKNRRHPQIIAKSGTAHQSLVGIWLAPALASPSYYWLEPHVRRAASPVPGKAGSRGKQPSPLL